MYCFTSLRNVGSGNNNKYVKRTAGHGTWRSTGTRRHIRNCNGAVVGSKLHLSYYVEGCTTASNWIMHEFRLPKSSKGDDLILCRIKGPSRTTASASDAPPPPPTDTTTTTMYPFLFSEDEPPDSDLRGLGLDPQLDGLGLGGGGDYYLNATTATPEPLYPQPQLELELELELPQLLPALPPHHPLPDTTNMHACPGSYSYNPNEPLDLRGINPNPLLDGLGGGLTATTATQPPPDHCSLPPLISPQPQPQPQPQMELGEGVCEGDEDFLAGFADDIEDKLLQDNNDEATSAATMAEQPPPQQMELGEGVLYEGGDEDSLAGLADDIEDKLLQDNNDEATSAATMADQPPPQEEGEDAGRCSILLLSPQSLPQLQMQQRLQDYNPCAAATTTVEQRGPLPTWDMWAGDWDITTDCINFDNLDQVCFMEQVVEEEQHQEEQQGRAGEPNSSSAAYSKQPGGGGDGSSTSAITPHLHHVSGHLGPEEANASKRRRSLAKFASPNSRCMPPQAKRPRPCPIQW